VCHFGTPRISHRVNALYSTCLVQIDRSLLCFEDDFTQQYQSAGAPVIKKVDFSTFGTDQVVEFTASSITGSYCTTLINGQVACWGNVPTALTGNANAQLAKPTAIQIGTRKIQTVGGGGGFIAYSDGYFIPPDDDDMYRPASLNFAPRYVVSVAVASSGANILVLDK
jgi:hypothetical protein